MLYTNMVFRIWLFRTQFQPDPKSSRSRVRIWGELCVCLGLQKNRPDETISLLPSTMLSAAIERGSTVQCFCYVTVCQFWQNLWNSNDFCIFFVRVTQVKIVSTPPDGSPALVLSVIDWTYCSCTGICQIRQNWIEICPEPDLAGFPKSSRIPDLRQPDPKSGPTPANYWSLLWCCYCVCCKWFLVA